MLSLGVKKNRLQAHLMAAGDKVVKIKDLQNLSTIKGTVDIKDVLTELQSDKGTFHGSLMQACGNLFEVGGAALTAKTMC